MMVHTYNTFVDHRVTQALFMVREYHIEGVIFYANRGCRIYNGELRAVSEALRQGASLPILFLEGEMVDGGGHSPEDIAEAVSFFCSSRADYITGQTLSVNGGLCMND